MDAEQNKKTLTLADWKKAYLFPPWARILISLGGASVLFLALILYVAPPQRDVSEHQVGKESYLKSATSDADPTTLTMGLFAVGVGFVVWGIIGIRYPKFEGFGITAEPPPLPDLADTPPLEKERLEQLPAAPPAAPVNAPAPGMAINGQIGQNQIHTFLLRSSWNGLLILKAAQVIKDTKKTKTINLRSLCEHLGLSFDYAFGYTIASFSADVIAAVSDPTSGLTRILDIHPVLRQRIDEIVDGNIRVTPELEPRKRADLAKLMEYLAKGS